MKLCSRCGERRPRSEFPPDKRRQDGLGAACRPCRRRAYPSDPEKTARYRELNLEKVRASETRRHRLRRAKITALKLTLACVDCGWAPRTEDEARLLEFDHVDPDTKGGRTGAAFVLNWKWERIEAELAKCEPRCKPCHAKRTGALGHNDWRARARKELA